MTVRLIASAFRGIVEFMNWCAIGALLIGLGFYIFKREEFMAALGEYGIYSDAMVLGYAFYITVAYILVMGLLCVFLEIYTLLDKIAENTQHRGQ